MPSVFSRAASALSVTTLALAVAFGVLCALYIAFAVHSSTAGFVADDALYLLLADHISLEAGARLPVHAYVAEVAHFPPLYPALLGVFGAGTQDVQTAHRVTVVMLLLCFACNYAWMRTAGAGVGAAVAITVLVAAAPGTLLFSLELWSEMPYMFFSALALLGVALAGRDGRFWWLAVVATGAAVLTRSAGIPLLVAVLAVLALRRPARWWQMCVVAVAGPVLWSVLRTDAGSGDSYVQVFVRSVSEQGAGAVLADLFSHAAGLWLGWVKLFDYAALSTARVVASLALLAAGIGLIMRVRRLQADALYVAGYLALMLLWGFPEHAERFMFPVFALMLFHGYIAVSALGARRAGGALRRGVPGFVYLCVLILLVAPSTVLIAGRSVAPVPAGLDGWTHTRYWLRNPDREAALDDVWSRRESTVALWALRAMVPADACIHAAYPQIAMLYTLRVVRVSPGLGFDPRPGPPCRYHYAMAGPAFAVEVATANRGGAGIRHVATMPGRADDVLGVLFEYPRAGQ